MLKIAAVLMGTLSTVAAGPIPSPPPSQCASVIAFTNDSAEAGNTECKDVVLAPEGDGGDGEDRVTIDNRSSIRYSVTYEALCTLAEAAVSSCYATTEPPCADGGPLITRLVVALNGPSRGEIVSQASYCDAEPDLEVPAEAVELIQETVTVTLAQFRRFPIQGSILASQPESFSLRNGHAHMYAVSERQSFDTRILDQNVRIRAIPIAYDWNYGDGTTRTLNQPGAPAPGHTFYDETPTSHVYTETGDYQVRLSTRFRGEYSTEGGPWIPIPGVANVPSEPMLMSVWRTKKLLVDSNCIENPKGPACDSPFLDEKP